jgi:anti-sigma factor RsiW
MADSFPMTCQELAQLVTDYWEGALEAADRTAFERHLSLCPPCVEFVEQMRATVEATGRVPVEAITPEVEAQLLERFRDWKRRTSAGD